MACLVRIGAVVTPLHHLCVLKTITQNIIQDLIRMADVNVA
jgi:hypothetical protein